MGYFWGGVFLGGSRSYLGIISYFLVFVKGYFKVSIGSISEIVHEIFLTPTAGWWRREGEEINRLGFPRQMCFRGDLNVYHRLLDRRKTREKAFVYPPPHPLLVVSWGYSWFLVDFVFSLCL